eukprot:CAMPEP_0176486796 /NCGR_PEP_ID=MMETSP0200_2-20121128/5765_1 /TAXON_ID=947934 /ORGANISM="Chaetoceros sp., Strain GSL56" /LENGTH=446 /DNA_ID=CAMNT_0017883533 /DNA_START=107 /DNA_END=1447 /DNA_ORIENTATION=+
MRSCIRKFVHKTTFSSTRAFFTTGGIFHPKKTSLVVPFSYIHPLISQPIGNNRYSIAVIVSKAASTSAASTTTAATTATTTTSSQGGGGGGGSSSRQSNSSDTNNDKNKNKTKTPGDIFLDNLGTIFLSAIGLLILTLIRSSKGTTNKNNLRSLIETCAALDPFEIDDLRIANDEFTVQTFRDISQQLEKKYGWKLDHVIDYKLFVSAVMQEMKGIKGEQFTIQLGHLIDRVVVSILDQQQDDEAVVGGEVMQHKVQDSDPIMPTWHNENLDARVSSSSSSSLSSSSSSQGLELRLLLVVLSLAMNSTVRERVQVLYDILATDSSHDNADADADADADSDDNKVHVVKEKDIIKMIGYLQKTCQLVPDAQIVESKTKYPVQEYLVGSPRELVILGKASKKEELSQSVLLNNDEGGGGWSCDDFHHLLRSRHVCAWGECYVKTKSLT